MVRLVRAPFPERFSKLPITILTAIVVFATPRAGAASEIISTIRRGPK